MTAPAAPSRATRRSPAEALLASVLTLHILAAAAWWYFMPGGFPISHPRFWVNGVMPSFVVVGCIGARFHRPAMPAVLAGLAIGWIFAGLVLRLLFPISFAWLFILPLLGGFVIALFWRGRYPWKRLAEPATIAAILVAVSVGVLLPLSQRPAAPGTHPLLSILPDAAHFGPATIAQPAGAQIPFPRIRRLDGAISFDVGRVSVEVNPILTLQSRSADGCWVLFASPTVRNAPERHLVEFSQQQGAGQFRYLDDGQTTMSVDFARWPQVMNIESCTQLPRTIWSHLNTFTELIMVGHHSLSVAFSPCPDVKIDVKSMDYPFGAPSRFAYLDPPLRFHVVEARSAEKGPFRELASGPLRSRNEPLAMTFYDEGSPIVRITLDDWASQCSTQLSPTAGWGVPENAIEFSLQGSDPTSAAGVFVTLAATSVGRGYDSVGHASGVYRNRIRIEPMAPQP